MLKVPLNTSQPTNLFMTTLLLMLFVECLLYLLSHVFKMHNGGVYNDEVYRYISFYKPLCQDSVLYV